MNAKELKRLTEKYYNGESTEEEERILRDYFKKNDIPEGYEAEKVIFDFYAYHEAIPEPSADFEAKILSEIDVIDTKRDPGKFRKFILQFISAAAGLLILAGSWFFFTHRNEPKDTFSDPAIAYAETVKILMAVSSQLNHGTQALEPVSKISQITNKSFKTISKSTGIIEKSLREFGNIQKAIEMNDVPVKKSINK